MRATVRVGYIPLVDAAPLIVARELGFDREEGLMLDLVRADSWSSLRDMLVFGHVDAAHLLSPVPVAMALGIGGATTRLSALMVMSVNGNVIGVSNRLAQRLQETAGKTTFLDAAAAGAALAAANFGRLRVGVPFPFSMHAELLYYWLAASGLPAPASVDVRTVPPSLMADALKAGEIDAFCVGEPWGSQTVERGLGSLLLPGCRIWSFAPEKVLAARTDRVEAEPDQTARLMRAVWRACRWLGSAGALTTASEILARPIYLDVPPDVIDRSLTGRLVTSPRGDRVSVDRFVEFHAGAASYPWRSQAAWIAAQMARRFGLDVSDAIAKARQTYRTDLYRQNLSACGAVLPGASEKVEGGITEETAVATDQGRLILAPNWFFDGGVFDLEGEF